MKNTVFVLVIAALSAISVAPPASAEPGVSADTITIGQWGPQTGPAALWGSVARGTETYFKMLNDEGGINGRKLKLVIRDDAYMPAKTKAVVKELLDDFKVFAFVGGVGTATGMAVKDLITEQKAPWVGMATGSSHFYSPPNPYVFALYPQYAGEAAVLTKYALDTLKKTKIAVLYQNDDYGKEGLKGVESVLSARGLAAVEKVSVEVLDRDLSSQVMKLKASGADAVVLWVLPTHAAIALGAARKVGFTPQWISSSTLSDAPLMYKLTEGAWDGVVFGSFLELPDSDSPLMTKYREAHKKYTDPAKERWGVFFYAGFAFAEPLVEALKKAGKEPTREGFVKAMETLKGFKGIMGPVTFSPGKRQGMNSVFVSKCEKGKAVKLTDWIEMDK
jgi:ABC-type branched-subunit amino acid transport system substrate-binding protein